MSVDLIRGDTWTRAWELKNAAGAPIDLTGVSARLQVRSPSGSMLLEASTANGFLTLTPLLGRVDMAVAYTDTNISPGNYKFDLEITHTNGVRKTYEQDVLKVSGDSAYD
jgi:hypothetical protein